MSTFTKITTTILTMDNTDFKISIYVSDYMGPNAVLLGQPFLLPNNIGVINNIYPHLGIFNIDIHYTPPFTNDRKKFTVPLHSTALADTAPSYVTTITTGPPSLSPPSFTEPEICSQQFSIHSTATAQAHAQLSNHCAKIKANFDRRSHVSVPHFKIGDIVLVGAQLRRSNHNSARKSTPSWAGPYIISKVLKHVYHFTELDGTPLRHHFPASFLKLFHSRPGFSPILHFPGGEDSVGTDRIPAISTRSKSNHLRSH
ncbi:uncharacterized protein NDAI_0G03630 [Naumovozyma dairenensis CBS 421]|uniref:Uncharacterized protein n=1 Tax=Naumovozyma dairenensis (strain ATCC 10597 / BCRC 20456 / CBS 421 / NBRC 0211 / NRRL Y-12639) TaxID=1071378 RepID=G0WEC9_NAUDC|nr:hypothetical protein NDAI_0G03630 [Naumovozyma dairenensis CBS 421]CCD26140.2 hypothetical protein NDAI_0G03630 [Naumovozyma dairenensis CBS 421]